MKICVLASGSSGNCTFVEIGGVKFLIDAGISAKRIDAGLREIGESISNIEGVLLTHEHSDHISGLPRLLEKYRLRLFTRRATLQALSFQVPRGCWFELRNEPFQIAELSIHAFTINHDSADPVGFRIDNSHHSFGYITDIGSVSNLVRTQLTGVDALVAEANYDPIMLRDGPYPWDLKRRIASRLGHLSNEDCGELLAGLFHDKLCRIYLAHRSEKNNDPVLSFDTVQRKLEEANYSASPVTLSYQNRISDVWEIE